MNIIFSIPEDILYTVVDLYVGEVGYLPMPEEVLLCSEDVSVEQASILLQRQYISCIYVLGSFDPIV